MKQFNKTLLTIFFVLVAGFSLKAQNRFFYDANESKINNTNYKRTIVPQKYRTVSVNTAALKNFLWSLPSEKNIVNRQQAPVMELPMPDGRSARFHVWESSIQEPGLEAKFPEMKTFLGQGIDDPYATIRFDYTGFGFHAQILSVNGNIYMDPYARGDVNNYMSYYSRDNKRDNQWVCQVTENLSAGRIPGSTNVVPVGPCRGTQLNTYRLAVACTGEYAVAVGGTTAALLHSAILTTVNRVVGVYEQELTVRMVLVANNNILEFLNAGTDPFNGNDDAGTLIGESETVISGAIGNANFDIGHTFSTGGGGLAGLGVVCQNGQKASGITGSPQPFGDGYDIDYVAHEMGHQFGGDHTFNSSASACGGGNRNAATAYEVGSGTTIMAYAGICGNDDIQPHSDPTFHSVSFDEISVYIQGTGGGCAVVTPTGNTLPQITSMANNSLSIPASTPFTLSGTATDADGDALTYCWEEWDLGASTTWNGGTANANSPLFKSLVPKTTGDRTFPDPARIAANYLPTIPAATMGGLRGETLPTSGRTMKFRLTVRDNHAGGGGIVTGGNGCQTGWTGTYSITVVSGSPFAVTVPNGGESYAGGSTQTVTWNVVGTNAAPFNVANVKISLSTDGGLTFPTVLLASTANDGSEAVTMPGTASTTARIKVEALANVFFDISNANFTITAAANGFSFNNVVGASVACGGPTSGAITLGTSVTGTFTTPINLTASGNPAGTTVSFATNPLTPGNSTTVTLSGMNTLAPGSYNVTITGTAGTVVQNSTLTYTVQPGTPPSITTQPTNVTICTGGNASFSVTSPTAGISYQWQVSTGGPFSDIPGATSATYSFTGAVTDNGNQYHVVITTLCGTVTSNNVTLTVNTAAAITTQPTSATECSGSNHTFSSTATGSNLTYQWQVSTGGPFTNIAGATSANLLLTAVTLGMTGYQYQVIVSGTGACAASVTSTAVTLTVVPGGNPSITTQPTGASVCSGDNTSFTVVSPSIGVTYQWQVSTGGPFSNIAGATSATYSFVAAQGDDGNQYQVVISTPCGSTTSTPVGLIVNTAANITDQPDNVTLCAGADATFTVTATGTGLSYQWQSSTGGPFTNIAGATAATLSIPAVNIGLNGTQYQVVVSGTGTCAAPNTSNTVTLNVNAMPTANAAADITTVCSGGSVELSTPAGAGSYSWTASSGTVANPTSATTTVNPVVDPANPSAPLDIVYTVTATTAGCSSTSSVTVTASPLPAVTLVADPAITALTLPSQVVTLTANVVPPGTGYTYVWTQNGSVIANSTASLPVNVANVGEYDVTVSVSGACASTSDKINIADSIPDQFFVYPNPNDGQFSIQVRVPNKIGNVTVFDSKGARVFAQVNITDRPNAFELISVDLRPANSGVYVLVIYDKSGERLTSQRIIVQH
ncbi:MAG: M12 family metallo-peptidase [Ferruginibacter sp.]